MTLLPSLWGNGNSICRSRDSALGILWDGRAGVRIQNIHNVYGTHLAFYSASGRVPGALWPKVQQPGSEVITHILILWRFCMSLQRGQTTFTQLGVVLRLQLRIGARWWARGMITKYCYVIFHTITTDQTRDECPESSVIMGIPLKARTLYFTRLFR